MCRTTDLERPDRLAGTEVDWVAQAGPGHWLMDMGLLGILCTCAIAAGLWTVTRSATRSE